MSGLEATVERRIARKRNALQEEADDVFARLVTAEADYSQAMLDEHSAWASYEHTPRAHLKERWAEAMNTLDLAYACLQSLCARARRIEHRMAELDRPAEFRRRLAETERLEALRHHGGTAGA